MDGGGGRRQRCTALPPTTFSLKKKSLYNYNENGFIYLIYSMHKVVFVYLSVKKKSWIFFVF
jgi:hypothetical protein